MRPLPQFASAWLIVLSFAPYAAGNDSPEGWGDLKGQIVLKGAIPKLRPLLRKGDKSAADAEICVQSNIPDHSLIVDNESRGISNVVFYIPRIDAQKIHPELAKQPADDVFLTTSGCCISPRITRLHTTQNFVIRTTDSVPHNLQILTAINSGQSFAPAWPENPVRLGRMNKSEWRPFEVRCAIHPWMRGFVLLLDHPYSVVTQSDGKFELKKAPTGKWRFYLWHERTGLQRRIDVAILKDQVVDLGRIELEASSFKLAANELDQ